MAIDIINATDAAISNFGGGTENVPARGYVIGSTLTTDAQGAAGVQANAGTAVLKNASSANNKAQVAGALIDSILADVNLGTPQARELFRIKKGLEEYEQISEIIGAP